MQTCRIRSLLHLTAEQRAELSHWQRATTVLAGLARRGRLLLLLDQGETLRDAARIAGMTVRNARKWVRRFLAKGVAGLRDQPRPGRRPARSSQKGDAWPEMNLRAIG
jgi:Helix-turn-helix domain